MATVNSLMCRILVGIVWGMLCLTVITDRVAAQAVSEPPLVRLTPGLRLTHSGAMDQDDICLWNHAADSSLHRVIASDKEANQLWVYDLWGQLKQQIQVAHPGNIDLRDNVPWEGGSTALVAVNLRQSQQLAVFVVDSKNGRLRRVDDNGIQTGENYGGTLLRWSPTNQLFFIVTSKEHGVSQFELFDSGRGQMSGRLVKRWDLPFCEGAVADDETGSVYIAVEQQGIVRIDGRPDGTSTSELMVRVGVDGFVGDAEGLVIVRTPDQRKLLFVSDQGASQFRIYQLANGTPLLGVMNIDGARDTDGFDITSQGLGPGFPQGAVVCHTNADGGRTVLVSDASLLWGFLKLDERDVAK